MEILIKKGSLLEAEADVIVNPANSGGYMGGGVAGVIKRIGGQEIENEAIKKAPIAVGSAVLTTAGRLPFKGVIHAPTMERPAMRTTAEKVRMSVRGALELAEKEGFKSIAFPGMGTGVGKVPKDVSARVMIEEIMRFPSKNIEKVLLIDLDEDMVKEWNKALKDISST